MKQRQSTVKISLKELPPEGRQFEFTNESGELNEVLKDLIGTNPYQLAFKLSAMGNSFDLRGHLKTVLDLQCSLCADDFKEPVHLNLHELLVIERALGKRDQTTKSNHAHEWETGGPSCIVLETDVFDVGEYAHEAIALAEPIRPLCAPNAPEGCARAGERVHRPWLSYGSDGNSEENARSNPFHVLEKVKLKS